jgi:hypothetical protein
MDGFVMGSATAPIQIEGFLDLQCPDCAGDWPTMMQVLAHYGPDKVSMRLHIFPLPYHTWSFKAAMAAKVIHSLNGTDASVFDFANVMYTGCGGQGCQVNFYNDAVATNSSVQIEQALADLAASTLGYSASAVMQGLQDPNMDEAARITWKYSTSRYTTGTPHYLLNGAPVDDQIGQGGVSDWEALIDGLGQPKAAKGKKGKRGSKRSTC